jgi:alkylated DNA repair dioxygenase AlkB
MLRMEQFLNATESKELFNKLLRETHWEQKEIKISGKLMKIPRLTAWHGEKNYTYSGIKNNPQPWTETLMKIKEAIEKETWLEFNSCLLNLYRNEKDSISWHSDDEPELGSYPIIASLSLGATRKFQTKEKRSGTIANYELKNGSLLIMPDGFQKTHLHQLPKSAKAIGMRINLTFR